MRFPPDAVIASERTNGGGRQIADFLVASNATCSFRPKPQRPESFELD